MKFVSTVCIVFSVFALVYVYRLSCEIASVNDSIAKLIKISNLQREVNEEQNRSIQLLVEINKGDANE